MNIWIIHPGELLPIDGTGRLFRYGLLANYLAQGDNSILRFAPTFAHGIKKTRCVDGHVDVINSMYSNVFIDAGKYWKNISIRRLLFHYKFAYKLLNEFSRHNRPDIILCGVPHPLFCAVSVYFGKKNNIPVVIDVRDLWPDIYFSFFPKVMRDLLLRLIRPFELINRYVFKNTAGITAVSNSYLQWGMSFSGRLAGPQDKVFYLGYEKHAVEHNHEINLTKFSKSGLKIGKKIFCFIGSFESSYDIETVLDAAVELERRGENDCQFVFCGDGAKKNKVEALSEIHDNIVYLGYLDQSELSSVMKMSYAGLCTYNESALQSIPNKPIEYFSSGLPIISSLRGDLYELIDEYYCGKSYSANNMEEFVATITLFINNPNEVEIMSDNSKSLFEKYFEANKVYSEFTNYLNNVILNG